MSGAQIEKLIAIAAADLGYKESPPNSNKTKFGKWYGLDGQPWCMQAVQYWFDQAGLSHLLYRTASCSVLMNYAKANGQFRTSGFRRGDLALFDFDGDKRKSEHVGIITDVWTSSVTTIEGNTSYGNDSNGGEVMERMRSNNLIIGVFRPLYEEKTETEDDEEMIKRYNTLAEIPEWGRATVRKLIDKGAIKGSGEKDKDGLPADLNLSEDMIRMLVFNDRAELYV